MKKSSLLLSILGVFFCLSTPAFANFEFFEAIKEGQVNKVAEFLKNGTDPNMVVFPEGDFKNSGYKVWNSTPLGTAIYYGHPNIVQLLLKRGAKPNKKNTTLDDPFYWHYIRRETSTPLEMILPMAGLEDDRALNGDYCEHCREFGDSDKGMVKIVQLLLSHGANANSSDSKGNSLVKRFTQRRMFKIISLLLDGGANPDLADKGGWTPLMVATRDGEVEIAALLILAGADPELRNKSGQTALEICLAEGGFRSRRFRDLFAGDLDQRKVQAEEIIGAAEGAIHRAEEKKRRRQEKQREERRLIRLEQAKIDAERAAGAKLRRAEVKAGKNPK